jgi:hypothetical protein
LCLTVRVIHKNSLLVDPYISNEHVAIIFTVHEEPLNQQDSVTSWKTRILDFSG